jgi:adenylate kinase family enzyme
MNDFWQPREQPSFEEEEPDDSSKLLQTQDYRKQKYLKKQHYAALVHMEEEDISEDIVKKLQQWKPFNEEEVRKKLETYNAQTNRKIICQEQLIRTLHPELKRRQLSAKKIDKIKQQVRKYVHGYNGICLG